MNVFVLCSGRCGSLTFIKACQHATNYTAGHESRDGMLGTRRFDYPGRHIEADNRLAWMLGRLDRAYGREAFYVHLSRNSYEVAESFARKAGRVAYNQSALILPCYAAGIARTNAGPMAVALDYIDTVTANIQAFLKDKPHQMHVDLECASEQFPPFWRRIEAQGNLEAALEELKERHNRS